MKKPLLIGLFLYTAVFYWFYPPICGIEDEQGFVNQTIFWSKGSVSAEGAMLSPLLGDLIEIDGKHVPMRHPGRSLITLPFYLIGGYHAIFISGYFIHVIMVLSGVRILGRLQCSENWALLLLFHPTLLIYSRTIMADASAGICLLIPVYVFAKAGRLTTRELITAGLGVSLASVMRHHAASALPVVAMAAYLRNKSFQSMMVVLIASAIGALPLIGFNLTLYGTIADPYSSSRGVFHIDYLKDQIPFYLTALSIFWPMMAFAVICVRGPIKYITSGTCLTFLVMLGCYYFHDTGNSQVQTMVLGLRLMQVALPSWIIAYVVVLDAWIKPKFQNHRKMILIQSLFLTGMTIMTFMIFQAHQNQLKEYENKRQALIQSVPSDSFILVEGMMPKLVGIYRENQPVYEFHSVTFAGKSSFSQKILKDKMNSQTPVYMLFSPKRPGDQPSPEFNHLIHEYAPQSIELGHLQVQIWKFSKSFIPNTP